MCVCVCVCVCLLIPVSPSVLFYFSRRDLNAALCGGGTRSYCVLNGCSCYCSWSTAPFRKKKPFMSSAFEIIAITPGSMDNSSLLVVVGYLPVNILSCEVVFYFILSSFLPRIFLYSPHFVFFSPRCFFCSRDYSNEGMIRRQTELTVWTVRTSPVSYIWSDIVLGSHVTAPIAPATTTRHENKTKTK